MQRTRAFEDHTQGGKMADLMEMREQEIRGHGVNAYKQAAKAQAQLTGSRRDRRAIQRANAR